MKKLMVSTLFLLLASLCGCQTRTVGPVDPQVNQQAGAIQDAVDVKAKLDSFARERVVKAGEALQNNRQHMKVTKAGRGYVARFSEVDMESLATELHPGSGDGCLYAGHIVYLEKEYEGSGKTIAEAKAGPFKNVKTRRLREIIRYDGTEWIY